MDENLEHEGQNKKSQAGLVPFIFAIINIVIAIFITVNLFQMALFKSDDTSEAVGFIISVVFFGPIAFGTAFLFDLLSIIFSSVAFVKNKKRIERIIVFVLSLLVTIASVIPLFIMGNR